ncbi:hypothetical protein MHK_009078, partial [Candidatus Magnetomorum sp. HK-1]
KLLVKGGSYSTRNSFFAFAACELERYAKQKQRNQKVTRKTDDK